MILKLNGQFMPSPSELNVSIIEVSSKQERNAAGQSVIDRLALKRRIDVGWSHLERHHLQWLLEHTNDIFFEVEYFDPMDDFLKTITCSVSDRSMGVFMYKDNLPVWTGVSMTFMER